jgi:hypothetical protein
MACIRSADGPVLHTYGREQVVELTLHELMGLFSSKNKQAMDYEEFTYKQLAPFPRVGRQETSTSDTSSTTAFITIGAALALANVLLAIALKPERHKLENTLLCGAPSRGEVIYCMAIFFFKEKLFFRKNAILTV